MNSKAFVNMITDMISTPDSTMLVLSDCADRDALESAITSTMDTLLQEHQPVYPLLTNTIALPWAATSLPDSVFHALWEGYAHYGDMAAALSESGLVEILLEEGVPSLSPMVLTVVQRFATLGGRHQPPSDQTHQERKRLGNLWQRYFLASCTAPELGILDVPRNLDSLEERLQILAVIVQSFMGLRHPIGLDDPHEVRPAMRMCLRIHAMEHLLHYEETPCTRLVKALLYLRDAIGMGCTLWLNVDTADRDIQEHVMARLGPDVCQALTHDLLNKASSAMD